MLTSFAGFLHLSGCNHPLTALFACVFMSPSSTLSSRRPFYPLFLFSPDRTPHHSLTNTVNPPLMRDCLQRGIWQPMPCYCERRTAALLRSALFSDLLQLNGHLSPADLIHSCFLQLAVKSRAIRRLVKMKMLEQMMFVCYCVKGTIEVSLNQMCHYKGYYS